MIRRMRVFIKNERGGLLALIGGGFVALVIVVGAGLDLARAHILKSKLSAALDTAGLAAGTVVNTQDPNLVVQNYFNVNFPAHYMGAIVTTPVVAVSADNRVLTLNVSATLPTTFMRLAGINSLTVSASSEITRQSKGMELALILDITGSMDSAGKIGALRTASQDLVDILYNGQQTIPNFYVAVVPFTASVNIGSSHTSWLTGYTASAYAPTIWKGCVEARNDPNDTSEANPAIGGRWHPYFWADNNIDNDWVQGAGYNVNEAQSAHNSGTGPNLGCPAGSPVVPLVAEKSAIDTAIQGLLPWYRGGTLSDQGLIWGWRVLSPNWRGLWGGNTPATLPLDYHTPLMDKVAILMTDGQNQFYDGSAADPPVSDYTAHGRVEEARMGAGKNTDATATPVVEANLAAICTAMKAQGIIIYTITFQLNNATTQSLFRNCATYPEYYFNSPSNADLIDAFHTIANSLGNLRISK